MSTASPLTASSSNQREYTRVSEGNIRGVLHSSWAGRASSLQELVESLKSEEGIVLRNGQGEGVTSKRQVDGEDVYCKIYRPKKFLQKARDLFGEGRVLREWRSNCRVNDLGIRTARIVVALTEQEKSSITHFLLTLPVPGKDMATHLRENRENPQAVEELIEKVARFAANLHGQGVWHAHLNCKHVFLDPPETFTLIDLERSRVFRTVPKKDRERNLQQLCRSLDKLEFGDWKEKVANYYQKYSFEA